MEAPGRDDQPHLRRVERDRQVGLDGRPGDLAGGRADPEGTSTETTGAALALIRAISSAASGRGSP